jgi:hypothetical protein
MAINLLISITCSEARAVRPLQSLRRRVSSGGSNRLPRRTRPPHGRSIRALRKGRPETSVVNRDREGRRADLPGRPEQNQSAAPWRCQFGCPPTPAPPHHAGIRRGMTGFGSWMKNSRHTSVKSWSDFESFAGALDVAAALSSRTRRLPFMTSLLSLKLPISRW